MYFGDKLVQLSARVLQQHSELRCVPMHLGGRIILKWVTGYGSENCIYLTQDRDQ